MTNAAKDELPKPKDGPLLFKPEEWHVSENFFHSKSESESKDQICECKQVLKNFEELFDPSLKTQLPSNDKMDETICQYKQVREHCTLCSALDTSNR